MQAELGIYVHVPFCAARCGYCDFNTYVPDGTAPQQRFIAAALAELELARERLDERPVSTVFFGGGTPTLLGAEALVALLQGITDRFELLPGAEVTTEANPESVDPAAFDTLRRGGFTRISLGMQSAARHVLATLDRVHTPGRAAAAAREARAAGFEHVSLDLIYGTPGESDADWRHSLESALAAEPDHISAYALTVEPGTAMAAAVRQGTLPAPDDEVQARRFLQADELLSEAGLQWYEISSWARTPAARCRHNVGYWNSQDWWGIGPGAHSHLAGVRWWNVLAPSAYAARLEAGQSPAKAQERLTPEQQQLEAVMLALRTREGVALSSLSDGGRAAALAEIELGRAEREGSRLVLTREGRLFADAVIRAVTD